MPDRRAAVLQPQRPRDDAQRPAPADAQAVGDAARACPNALDNIVMRRWSGTRTSATPTPARMAADIEEYLREVRFSSETLVKLLEELFADEDSARELPLPDDGFVERHRIKISPAARPASSGDRCSHAVAGSGADDAENGYATVSSIHRLSEIAGRHRRRRLLTASARWGGAAGADGCSLPCAFPGGTPTTSQAGVDAGTRWPRTPDGGAARPRPKRRRPPRSKPPAAAPPTGGGRRARWSPAAIADQSARQRGRRPQHRPSIPAKGRKALARGMQALNSGEYMRAVQELENACQASPRDHEALRALAEAEFELARYGRALAPRAQGGDAGAARGQVPHAGRRQLLQAAPLPGGGRRLRLRRRPGPGRRRDSLAPAAGQGQRSAAATRPRAQPSGAKSKPPAGSKTRDRPAGRGDTIGAWPRPDTPPPYCPCPWYARARWSTSWRIPGRRAPGCRSGCSPTRR